MTTRLLPVLLALAALPGLAAANARLFTYSYESAVLPAGGHEFEVSTTWRVGRTDVYSRLDQRAEFEYGITDRLLTALYLNWRKVSAYDPALDAMVSESEFSGVSSEWKFKVLDRTADPVGLAGYVELSGDTDEAEVEAKLILDKTLGPVTLAYNAVTAGEWGWEPHAFANREREIEHVAGLTFAPGAAYAVGGEVRAHTAYAGDDENLGAVFAGPVFHLAHGEFWLTASCLFQVKGLSTDPEGETYELLDHERVNVRVLLSLPL